MTYLATGGLAYPAQNPGVWHGLPAAHRPQIPDVIIRHRPKVEADVLQDVKLLGPRAVHRGRAQIDGHVVGGARGFEIDEPLIYPAQILLRLRHGERRRWRWSAQIRACPTRAMRSVLPPACAAAVRRVADRCREHGAPRLPTSPMPVNLRA
jgi:hypothetical protein